MPSAEIVITGLQLFLVMVGGERFRGIKSRHFKHLLDHESTLKAAAWSGIWLNIIILARQFFGIPCWLYLSGVFMTPALTAGSTIVLAVELLCEISAANRLMPFGNGKIVYPYYTWLPQADPTGRRTFKIMGVSITVHSVIVGAFLGARGWIYGGDALFEDCVMASEMWALVVLFVVYMLALFAVIILYGVKVNPEYRLPVVFVWVSTGWYMLSLVFFFGTNIDRNTYLYWMQVFDPAIWGMIFNLGSTLIPFGLMPLVEMIHSRVARWRCCGGSGPRGKKSSSAGGHRNIAGFNDDDEMGLVPTQGDKKPLSEEEIRDIASRIIGIYSRKKPMSFNTEFVWASIGILTASKALISGEGDLPSLFAILGHLAQARSKATLTTFALIDSEITLITSTLTKRYAPGIYNIKNYRAMSIREADVLIGELAFIICQIAAALPSPITFGDEPAPHETAIDSDDAPEDEGHLDEL